MSISFIKSPSGGNSCPEEGSPVSSTDGFKRFVFANRGIPPSTGFERIRSTNEPVLFLYSSVASSSAVLSQQLPHAEVNVRCEIGEASELSEWQQVKVEEPSWCWYKLNEYNSPLQ